jgi:hypothetical protein
MGGAARRRPATLCGLQGQMRHLQQVLASQRSTVNRPLAALAG